MRKSRRTTKALARTRKSVISKFNLSISNVITKSVEVKSIAKYFYLFTVPKKIWKRSYKSFHKIFSSAKKTNREKIAKILTFLQKNYETMTLYFFLNNIYVKLLKRTFL